MTSISGSLPYTTMVAALSAALAFVPIGARAQQGPAEPVGAAAGKPPADETATIQEVVVTAQKRRERASKVPSAISVIGEAQLENRHVTQLSDLAGTLPSVQIATAGSPGQTQFSVRGIPTIGQGAVVGTYIDDTPLGSSANFAQASSFVLDLLPYDVARIELLRGPQGTLYGASSMGGLLKYVTNDPDLKEFSGVVGGGASAIKGASGSGWDGHLVLNVPLIKDELAVRATLANNRTPGYVDNALTGQSGINKTQQTYGRLAVLWQPNQQFSAKVSALRQKIDASDVSTVVLDAVTLNPPYGNRTGKLIAEPFGKTVDYYALTLNGDLGWADLTSASSYSKTITKMVNDDTYADGLLLPLFGYPSGLSTFVMDLNLKKFTQELRLASKQGGRIEWQINGFYTRETSINHQVVTAQTMTGAPVAGLDPMMVVELPTTYKEKAVYGNLMYKFTDRFDIMGGVRYAMNDQDYRQVTTAGVLIPLGATHSTSSENVTTYMFGPRYHLSADSMLYGRIASGYRPGGPNVTLPGVPPTVKSDQLVNYEIGLKSLFFARRLGIELAAYQINWRDIQLSALTANGNTYKANAGTATSKGVELSTTLRATPAWQLAFNTTYTHARLTQDAAAVSGKAGDTLQGIPTWSWSLNSDYHFALPNGWASHVGGGYAWTGARNSGESSDPVSRRMSSYGMLGMNADVAKGAWLVRGYVKNLNNSRALTSLTPVFSSATGDVSLFTGVRPQPRTVGIDVDLSF